MTWGRNVSYFRLLSPTSVERALSDLLVNLAKAGQLKRLPEMAEGLDYKPLEIEGFDLFTQSGFVKPYRWFLTKPNVNIAQFLRVYDKVADYPLLELDAVGVTVSKIYQRNSPERAILARFTKPDQWLSPSMLLAACAQHMGAELISKTSNSVQLRLGPGFIRVSPLGCWSNSRSQVIPAVTPDRTPDKVITTFPNVKTTHPVLKALWQLADESDYRYAVTTAAHAMNENIINNRFLQEVVRFKAPLAKKALDSVRNPVAAHAALEQCESILNAPEFSTMSFQCLYSAAVPMLMSYRQLQSIIGAPSQVSLNRKINPKTIEAWKTRLRETYEDLVEGAT